MTKRVLILVTHLLGAGHLTRATALARAFAQAGHSTTLVSGGMRTSVAMPDDVIFVQLPPVQTRGTNFSALLDDGGRPVTPAFLAERCDYLLETVNRVRPDILITELFPFGRRVLADEFLAVLREAHLMRPRPLVLSSIRDILVAPTKPERVTQAVSRIDEFYDAVLVHGDPAVAPLDMSWPVDDRLRPLLRYTGYVDEAAVTTPQARRAGIIVSGGSSAASLPLYRSALAAAQIVTRTSWRVLVGRGIADEDFRALQRAAPGHVTVERARPDFRQLLAGADVSISQAGYNTSVDILRSGVRAILVPFEAGHETEQRQRAECLQQAGLAQVLPEDRLDARSLADAVTSQLEKQLPPSHSIALDGAHETLRITAELALSRPALLSPPIDWSPLDTAIDRSRDRCHEPVMWWRDDDAVRETPQLDRLLQLANRYKAGLAVAAVPRRVEPSLERALRDEERVSILVHGYTHANHAPTGKKKAEFDAERDLDAMEAEVRTGLRDLGRVFGDRLLRVLVPPWNRIPPALLPRLAGAGYVGLSTFRDRPAPQPAPGLVQINTHIDPIEWHGTRSLGNVPALVAALAGAIDRRASPVGDGEPIGLLTHHLVHDECIWAFCEELLLFLARKQLHFAPVRKLFCDKSGNVVEP
ncbi:glycosyltransferase [Microvirga brassicacearum]|uniref:Glycosyl transferase family 28 n=1 Tax=Microvirga brassicacearum TaxID=2580413 RepID=A0A5N3PJ35_9HYPH|nr:glycosyltransferase [Microvirga brassicacearum]KAB0269746.1 glycosyl transferase family 28 [Microvirga brassicacearum]